MAGVGARGGKLPYAVSMRLASRASITAPRDFCDMTRPRAPRRARRGANASGCKRRAQTRPVTHLNPPRRPTSSQPPPTSYADPLPLPFHRKLQVSSDAPPTHSTTHDALLRRGTSPTHFTPRRSHVAGVSTRSSYSWADFLPTPFYHMPFATALLRRVARIQSAQCCALRRLASSPTFPAPSI